MGSSIPGVNGSSGANYNAVFTDEGDQSYLDQTDFLKLLVAELTNQDFTNPTDTSDMINTMASYSTIQAMSEMTGYSKTNYALSLVGKTVTASRFGVNGELDTTTGTVQKVSLVDGEYVIYVGGKTYTLSQIMSVSSSGSSGSASSNNSTVTPSNFSFKASDITDSGAQLTWQVPTEDEKEAAALKYALYYSVAGELATVAEAETGILYGTGSLSNFTSAKLENLDANTTYYANVVVTDSNGNKSVYSPLKFTTLLKSADE